MYSVLIADDHPLVRAGFRRFLQADASIFRVGEATTAAEALSMSRSEHWDLVVLDIALPDRSGLDILSDLHESNPGGKVLVMSGMPERQFAVHALRLGADGYLSKHSAPEELMKALHSVLSGGQYVSAALAEALAEERQQKRPAPRHEQLSAREFQIFCKLAAGRSTSSMARELGLSSKTVSTYRGRIFHKMKFHANADLVAYAIRHSLLSHTLDESMAAPKTERAKPDEEPSPPNPS
jgi:two-component system, NarL family, invasion response regulator UvrY